MKALKLTFLVLVFFITFIVPASAWPQGLNINLINLIKLANVGLPGGNSTELDGLRVDLIGTETSNNWPVTLPRYSTLYCSDITPRSPDKKAIFSADGLRPSGLIAEYFDPPLFTRGITVPLRFPSPDEIRAQNKLDDELRKKINPYVQNQLSKRPMDAEDATQESIIKIHEKTGVYNGEDRKKGFENVIVKGTVFDYRKSAIYKKPRVEITELPPQALTGNLEKELIKKMTLAVLNTKKLVKELNQRNKKYPLGTILLMRAVEKKQWNEIAKKFGITRQTAKNKYDEAVIEAQLILRKWGLGPEDLELSLIFPIYRTIHCDSRFLLFA